MEVPQVMTARESVPQPEEIKTIDHGRPEAIVYRSNSPVHVKHVIALLSQINQNLGAKLSRAVS